MFWIKTGGEVKDTSLLRARELSGDNSLKSSAVACGVPSKVVSSTSSKTCPVMRTQTSAVQARFLEKNKNNLPCAIVVPGKVFRNEATDATHEAQFTQLEALFVDKDVSLGHLKGVIEHFLKRLYGDGVEIRFRPSFFPFVEPGVEVDMKFNGKWLEMGGAGMVHPNVFTTAGIDPTVWKGFAFGFGIDRLVMMKHNITDIRLLSSGDLRFVNQF